MSAAYDIDAAPGKKISLNLQAMILGACVLFNFALCFLNTSFFDIFPSVIMACEMVLVTAAIAYGFQRLDSLKSYWVMILGFQLLLFLILMPLRDEVMLKPVRDMLIVPVFVILGLSSGRLNMTKFVVGLSAIIAIVGLFEAFASEQFLNIFNFKQYYINKGSMEDLEWMTLNTFASGIRPEGRFLFDLPGIHRISSVFLEPVSLGFYGFVSGLYMLCARDTMGRTLYWSGLFLSFLLIWLSDGRMAFGCLVICFALRDIIKHIDHRFFLLIFPAMLVLGWLIDLNGLMSVEGEGFGARIRWTIDMLSQMTLPVFLGAAHFNVANTTGPLDSALGYLLDKGGLLLLLLYWLPPYLFVKTMSDRSRVCLFGISVFLAFGFLLSAAIFTIKTAALLWFLFGYFIAADREEPSAA